MFIITLMFGSIYNASTGMAVQEKKNKKKQQLRIFVFVAFHLAAVAPR